ncbi:hypothetical protein Gotur_030210 [Gossypium turneri]
MNLMPGGSSANFEALHSQPYDSRNYFQVDALQPATNYYNPQQQQDQIALQLLMLRGRAWFIAAVSVLVKNILALCQMRATI